MKLKKLVLSGAAGSLGSRLREPLSRMCDELVSTDIENIEGELFAGEQFVQADLADFAQVEPLMQGADMVIHFGAIVDEVPFEEIWGPNFMGSYNVWEAGHRHGVRRVIYASSIHAVGMYPSRDNIGIEVAHRPDTFYGLAKCFTEDLGRMYWEKRGMESVHLRIASCAPVSNTRALGTWLSYDDMIHLVVRAIETPVVQWSVIYGVSDNDRAPVNNVGTGHLGYRPKDNAETFAPDLLASAPCADPNGLGDSRLGGPFAAVELGQSGMAGIRAMNKKTAS